MFNKVVAIGESNQKTSPNLEYAYNVASSPIQIVSAVKLVILGR